MMCDSSDPIDDLKKIIMKLALSNLISGSKNFPYNRIFNYFVKIAFWSDYNRLTNAFKIYKKDTLIKIFTFSPKF